MFGDGEFLRDVPSNVELHKKLWGTPKISVLNLDVCIQNLGDP